MDYRVGFVDDLENMIEKYSKKLARDNISLIYASDCLTFNDVFEWILDNTIEYLLIDYNLSQKYNFSGSQLIHYINNMIPDLPCIIFSSVKDINDDLVQRNLIKEKDIFEKSMDDIEYKKFIDEIKNGVEVFKKRKEASLEEYNNLLMKKNKDGFTNSSEEERFIYLYKILMSYGMVDKISPEIVKSSVEAKIDNLISKLDKYI